MTVTSTVRSVSYVGAGSTGPYPFTFKVFAATELYVTRLVVATGSTTVLIYPTHFSVAAGGIGADGGGSITLVTALAAGETLTIKRVLPFTQLTDLRNQGGFFPETHEDQFDRVVMLLQQLSDTVGALVPVDAAGVGLRWGLPFTFDGAGGVVAVGKQDPIVIPDGMKSAIRKWRVRTIPAVATVVLDIWKDTGIGNYPPTVADSIVGAGINPFVTADDWNEGTDFTSWTTTTLNPGDELWPVVEVNSAATLILLQLDLERIA